MSTQTFPACSNCFWFKVKWDQEECGCEHPQYQRKIPVDKATEQTFCNGKGWAYRGDDAFPFRRWI